MTDLISNPVAADILSEFIRPMLTMGLIGYLLAIWKKTARRMDESDKVNSQQETQIQLLKLEIHNLEKRHDAYVMSTEKALEKTQRDINKILSILLNLQENKQAKGNRWYDNSED